MDSRHDDRALPRPGCPIRRSPDQHLLSGFPELIAASHVLHRLLAPRHSPCALSSLTTFATGHPCTRVPRRNAWVSYHALALTDGLPVQIVKDRLPSDRSWLRSSTRDRSGSPIPYIRTASGIARGHRNGADGGRTHDLRLAKPALSQLSYSPGREGSCCGEATAEGRIEGPPSGSPSSLPSHTRSAFISRQRPVLIRIVPPLLFHCS